ncbi:MAG: transglycosylase SLT domain-containing protein, partial [Bacteroidota bacterium]
MRKIACLILMLWGFSAMKAQVPIPDQMTYCGVELRFSPGAKRILSDHVRKFYESPRYFNEMVKRANIYMPFIEEALRNVGAPEDLKYLSIQESALRPDVVSKSNAVGFWQFKEATGVEMGLRINDRVDERRHIYRATEAAGKYLLKANRDFDNWIYAVLAYYEGLTGAVPYTDPQYYSNRKMFVREDMHWYVLKAIAHKIAYEAPISQRRRPDINLLPYSNLGEENLRALLDRHPEVEWSAFFEYNKWILNSKKLPRNELFTYYLPQKGEFYSGHKEDPNKVSGGGIAVYDPATTPQFSETIGVDEPTETRPISSSVPRPTSGRPSKILEDDVPVEKAPVYSAEENTVSVAEVSDEPPVRPPSRPTSTNILDQWTARPFSELGEFEYVEFILEQDLHYGVQYVFYNGSKRIVEIANEYQKRLSDLLTWNGLIPGEEPQTGSVVYLAKPSRLDYHIVRPRETLQNIAALHLSSVKKLRKYNRLPKNDQTIYIGQKLYLT